MSLATVMQYRPNMNSTEAIDDRKMKLLIAMPFAAVSMLRRLAQNFAGRLVTCFGKSEL
jgi:hypothetical protein